jgi:lipoprotein-anchoring transpeptidase ErfK/SrfK
VEPSAFSGLLLDQRVDFRFGWVLYDSQSIDASGNPLHNYPRYAIIREIPSQVQKAGYVSVGDGEWLPENALALTNAQVPGDAGRYQCRFIHVDLANQILRAYDDCLLVFATLVSTGENPAWTFPGWFFVNHKDEEARLNSPQETISTYYLESVPYFMSYYGDLGFHGVYWHDDFGTPVSHGCINLSPADARWLFEWADIGELAIISAGD